MIIFDLDGTLSDPSHRENLIDHSAAGSDKWDKFHDACIYDPPIDAMVQLFRTLVMEHHCAIWTARPERVRYATEKWLDKHVFNGMEWTNGDDPLFTPVRMRPANSLLTSANLKESWLLEELQKGRVQMAFEDRDSVVKMYRRHGILCAQVGNGNYE